MTTRPSLEYSPEAWAALRRLAALLDCSEAEAASAAIGLALDTTLARGGGYRVLLERGFAVVGLDWPPRRRGRVA